MTPLLPYLLIYGSGVLATLPESREFLLPFFLPLCAGICGACLFHQRIKRQLKSSAIRLAGKWIFLFLFLPLGYLLVHAPDYAQPENHILRHLEESQKADITGTVIALPAQYPERVRYLVQLDTVQYPSAPPLTVTGVARITLYHPENSLRPGDRVLIKKVRLKLPRNFKNPGRFDYAGYMRSQGIDVTGNLSRPDAITRTGRETLPLFTALPLAIKERMFAGIDRNLPQDAAALLKAMLLGEKSFLSEELRETYIATGLAHLMAVSGLHIGFVAATAFFLVYPALFSVLYRWRQEWVMAGYCKKFAVGICLVPVLFYMMVVGAKISSLRAGMFVIIYILAILVGRERSLFNSLVAAAFLILLWRPGAVLEPGFQLSFMAVFTILYGFQTLIKPQGDAIDRMGEQTWFRKMFRLGRGAITPSEKILGIFTASAFIGLAASLGTLPILIHYFNRISLCGFLMNVFMVPLASILIPLALGLLTVGLVWPWIADAFFPLVGMMMQFFLTVPEYAASFHYASMYVPTPPQLWFPLYYFILFGLCWQYYLSRQAAEGNPNKPYKAWRHPFPYMLALPLIMMVVWMVAPRFPQKESDQLAITMLDVGQGESIFIEFPNHQTMLIDGGGFYKNSLDVGKLVVAPFLWRQGLRKIDYMAATHSDNDHIAGLESLLDIMKVKHFLARENTLGDRRLEKLRKKAIEHGAQPVLLEVGKPLVIGEVRIIPLHPDREFIRQRDKPASEKPIGNPLSLVLRVEYREFSMLLTGDITMEAEEYLLRSQAPLRAMVLKAPHHGSRHSSSPEFIQAVSPREVLFSVGHLNFFRHPYPTVVESYRKAGANIRRTDRHGAIKIVTDGHGYRVEDHPHL